jgi:hypothetical protein|tara:strand:- start:6213 stop:6596 length:384 start_codon:yes stop_codon:yes gene_type:complete
MKLIIEDVTLYSTEIRREVKTESYTGYKFNDVKEVRRSFRVFGTKKQIEAYYEGLCIDEVYKYEKFIPNTREHDYWNGICFSDKEDSTKPTLEEYNNKFDEKYTFYKTIYDNHEISKDWKPLVINSL